MGFRTLPVKPSRRAFTLVELLAAVGVSSLVMGGVLAFYLYSNRSFVSLTNHVFMQEQSRFAMDYMSREIRQTRALLSYSPTALTFKDYDSNTLQFVYSPTQQTLSRVKGGYTNELLMSCSSLQFNVYSNNLQSGTFDVTTVPTNATACRVVSVAWSCSRTVRGVVSSDEMQSAKILIRNKNAP